MPTARLLDLGRYEIGHPHGPRVTTWCIFDRLDDRSLALDLYDREHRDTAGSYPDSITFVHHVPQTISISRPVHAMSCSTLVGAGHSVGVGLAAAFSAASFAADTVLRRPHFSVVVVFSTTNWNNRPSSPHRELASVQLPGEHGALTRVLMQQPPAGGVRLGQRHRHALRR
uniref:hypothetical protein n=1 Tax=Nocardia suismassiliense TaxID=2077092 RepID=UPI003F492AD2